MSAARAKKTQAPAPIDAEFDRRMMAAVLRLGRRNLGHTGVNPAVGCVIVRESGGDRVVVGNGWTAVGGRPHAEKEALAAAGKAAKGATVYVSLEPCAHEGKVPPCAEALVKAGVARVVTAMEDPDPRTAGRGHALLTAAGIAVTTGVLAAEAAAAHSGHVARIRHGRPHVTLKLAVSADGMIGKKVGERMIITGMAAFDAVQTMRTTFDVVTVGIGTVMTDDPQLTVRLPGLARLSPARVIVDTHGRLPLESRLVKSVEEAPLIVVAANGMAPERKTALAAAGVEVVEVAGSGDKVDLVAALAALAERGFTRVLAEGGAEIAASLVADDLIDEVVIFRAPVVVGPDGVRALAGTALSAIERSPRYALIQTLNVGEDVMRRYLRAA
jgi:diaminohydroxyphosphoribosylaminopyrimidine deaminase/5-amino-6-(5-phosphoribosylamino)uracil reductase